MYTIWTKMASLTKCANTAEVRINLFSFLNGFKLIRTEIINDTLIVSFEKLENTKSQSD